MKLTKKKENHPNTTRTRKIVMIIQIMLQYEIPTGAT